MPVVWTVYAGSSKAIAWSSPDEVDDAQLQAAGDALGDDQVLGEDVDVVEHDVVARRDQRLGAVEVGLAASTVTRRKLRPVSLMRT